MTRQVRLGASPGALSPDEQTRLRLWTEARQDGGNPSQFLDLLAHVVEDHLWTRLVDETGRPLSFRALVEAPLPVGIGMAAEDLLALAALRHQHERQDGATRERMARMRRAVRDLLAEPLARRGRPAGGKRAVRTFSAPIPARGSGSQYLLRLLRRDHPALAARVLSGTLSANQAAVLAGVRQRRVSVPLDVGRAAAILSRAFPPADRARLAEALGAPEYAAPSELEDEQGGSQAGT